MGGGTPDLARVPPPFTIQTWLGYPPPFPGMGYPPPSRPWWGVPQVTPPHHPDMAGVPPPHPRDGVPPPPSRHGWGNPHPRPGMGYWQVWQTRVKTLPSLVLRTRAVKKKKNFIWHQTYKFRFLCDSVESLVPFQDTWWVCVKYQTRVPDGAGGLQIVESVPESSETSTADFPRSLGTETED